MEIDLTALQEELQKMTSEFGSLRQEVATMRQTATSSSHDSYEDDDNDEYDPLAPVKRELAATGGMMVKNETRNLIQSWPNVSQQARDEALKALNAVSAETLHGQDANNLASLLIERHEGRVALQQRATQALASEQDAKPVDSRNVIPEDFATWLQANGGDPAKAEGYWKDAETRRDYKMGQM